MAGQIAIIIKYFQTCEFSVDSFKLNGLEYQKLIMSGSKLIHIGAYDFLFCNRKYI